MKAAPVEVPSGVSTTSFGIAKARSPFPVIARRCRQEHLVLLPTVAVRQTVRLLSVADSQRPLHPVSVPPEPQTVDERIDLSVTGLPTLLNCCTGVRSIDTVVDQQRPPAGFGNVPASG